MSGRARIGGPEPTEDSRSLSGSLVREEGNKPQTKQTNEKPLKTPVVQATILLLVAIIWLAQSGLLGR